MKIFKLSEKAVCFYFKNANTNQLLPIKYQLYNHELIDRWLALLNMSGILQGQFGGTNFTGQLIDDEDFLVTTLNALILKINTCLKKLNLEELTIHHQINKGVPQTTLNELHRYFEIHANHPKLKTPLKNTFRLLNLLIHRMENFSDGKINNCVLIEVTPAKWDLLPLLKNDYQLFDMNWKWGELLLNYCMLGVPTMQSFLNDSIPKPQSCFSAGVYLSFVDDKEFDQIEALHNWLESKKMDPKNPECAIGYIPLGRIMDPQIPINEEDRIKFLLQFKEYNQLVKVEYIGSNDFIKVVPSLETPMGIY